jgi:hypothetical protein
LDGELAPWKTKAGCRYLRGACVFLEDGSIGKNVGKRKEVGREGGAG